MRPVGSVGNEDDENCWIRLDKNSVPKNPLHPELQTALEKLDIIQQNGKKFGMT